MHIYARQGDLVIDKLAQAIGDELCPAVNPVLAGDSSGHRHTVIGAVLVRRVDDRRTRLRVTEETRIEHAGNHPDITLVPGDYEIRRLREDGDRLVQD